MRVRTALVWASGAALSLGVVGVPIAASAEDNGSPTATVTQTAGIFTVTLPGIGTVSFGVDPTTQMLTGLTVTPSDPSVTAGTPVITEEGIQVRFDTSTGPEVLEVEVEQEGAVSRVTAEVALPEDAAHGDQAGNNEGGSDGAGDGGPDNTTTSPDDGEHATGTTPTTAPAGEDNAAPEHEDTTTTTTVPSSSTDGGSSDGGSTAVSSDSGGNTSGDSSGSSSDGSGSDG